MRYVRTQVQLSPEQYASLRRLARDRGVSIASLLREGANRVLQDGSDNAWVRALAAVGKYESGTQDTSVEHDRVFVDAIME
jgi:predicted DNA-binding ribbon-helix-helix protein